MNSASQLNEYCMKSGLSIDREYSFFQDESLWYCFVTVGQWKKSAHNINKKQAYKDACGKVLLKLMEMPIADAISLHGGESVAIGSHGLLSPLERIEIKLDRILNKLD